MKAYRPKYRVKGTSRFKNVSHWCLTFMDNQQTRRRLPAFSSKAATERLGQTIEELLSCGGVVSRDLQKRIEALPQKTLAKLVEWQIVEGRRTAENIGKTLEEHRRDFCAALRAKGNTPRYAKETGSKLASLFEARGFRYWSELDGHRVYTYLANRRGDDGIGERTSNSYLQAVKEFARWMSNRPRP